MPGSGVGDYFLKLDGIAGDSTDTEHQDQLELVSFTWGVTRAAPSRIATSASGASGRVVGKAQVKQFEFLVRVSKASPALFLAAVSGKHLKDASLSVRRGPESAFDWLKVKFSDVVVTSYEQSADEETPHELVAFDFATVELQVTPETAQGTAGIPVAAGWNLTRNLKI